jgi:hypothetical protein
MKKGKQYQDNLVEALSEGAQSEGFEVLHGWLGKSDRPGYQKIYGNEEMTTFVEVKEEDIQMAKSLESSDDPMAGSLIWVSTTAEVITTSFRKTNIAERTFLQGDFVDELEGTDESAMYAHIGGAGSKRSRRKRGCRIRLKRSLNQSTCKVCCW